MSYKFLAKAPLRESCEVGGHNPSIADEKTFYRPYWYNLDTTDNTPRITFDMP